MATPATWSRVRPLSCPARYPSQRGFRISMLLLPQRRQRGSRRRGRRDRRVIDLTGMTGGGMAQESIREGGGPSCWWCAARGCARKRDCSCNEHARASERANVQPRRTVWGWKRAGGGRDEEKNEGWRKRQRGGGPEERGSREYFHTPDSRRR